MGTPRSGLPFPFASDYSHGPSEEVLGAFQSDMSGTDIKKQKQNIAFKIAALRRPERGGKAREDRYPNVRGITSRRTVRQVDQVQACAKYAQARVY